jgi:hypothetical protein
MLSFMSVAGAHAMNSDEIVASQQHIPHDSAVTDSLVLPDAPAAVVLSSDSIAASDADPCIQSTAEQSSFSFLSPDASDAPSTDASADAEFLASQAPVERAIEDGGSAFAFLSE